MRRQTWKLTALVFMTLCGVAKGWAMVSGAEVAVKQTTVPGVAENAIGTFDLTGADALMWRSGKQTIAVPYKTLSSFSYSKRLARHLGVAPVIVESIIRKRERKHYFIFTWKDEAGVAQVLEVEVPKDMPRGLLAVLRARAPQACTPAGKECGIDHSADAG